MPPVAIRDVLGFFVSKERVPLLFALPSSSFSSEIMSSCVFFPDRDIAVFSVTRIPVLYPLSSLSVNMSSALSSVPGMRMPSIFILLSATAILVPISMPFVSRIFFSFPTYINIKPYEFFYSEPFKYISNDFPEMLSSSFSSSSVFEARSK